MSITDETDTSYGEEYRWWENDSTRTSVAHYLVNEKNATGQQMLDFMEEPWHYTAYYEEWFTAQVLEL